MAVCSEIHTKHTTTLCGQKAGSLNLNLVVHTLILKFNFSESSDKSLSYTFNSSEDKIFFTQKGLFAAVFSGRAKLFLLPLPQLLSALTECSYLGTIRYRWSQLDQVCPSHTSAGTFSTQIIILRFHTVTLPSGPSWPVLGRTLPLPLPSHRYPVPPLPTALRAGLHEASREARQANK